MRGDGGLGGSAKKQSHSHRHRHHVLLRQGPPGSVQVRWPPPLSSCRHCGGNDGASIATGHSEWPATAGAGWGTSFARFAEGPPAPVGNGDALCEPSSPWGGGFCEAWGGRFSESRVGWEVCRGIPSCRQEQVSPRLPPHPPLLHRRARVEAVLVTRSEFGLP